MRSHHRPEFVFSGTFCPADFDVKDLEARIGSSSCFQHSLFYELIYIYLSLSSFSHAQILFCSVFSSVETNNGDKNLAVLPEDVAA